jgi:hypothetical protein
MTNIASANGKCSAKIWVMAHDPILIEIRNAAGVVKIVEFSDRRALAEGLRIGSDPACELRIPGAPRLHGLLQPRSNHWVWYQAEHGVLPRDYTRRVDYGPIEVAGYAICVLPPLEEQE